jgi:hypothetical protein
MTTNNNLDDEWEKFMTTNDYHDNATEMELDIADEDNINGIEHYKKMDSTCNLDMEAPQSNNIRISTKSKISFLDSEFNLSDIFWKLPIIPYYLPQDGIIKKQMKFNSSTKEEVDEINNLLKKENYYDTQIIKNIDNPIGRIKYKDVRKINVGISKKDIISYRIKPKSAFYNCFVMIIRIYFEEDDLFRDFHVKVFNTGKIEIPGIPNDLIFDIVLQRVIDILSEYIPRNKEENMKTLKNKYSETILINSNFNCGFYINREVLLDILKYKYNVQCIYDPCSYPGVQCKFFYDTNLKQQINERINKKDKKNFNNLVDVSYMVFRTGSVLVVGKCNEDVLMIVYNYIRTLLINEFHNISIKMVQQPQTQTVTPIKTKKSRKRNIIVS